VLVLRDYFVSDIVTFSASSQLVPLLTEPNEAGELDRLREQVTELTQRVFRLEQILEGGASAEYSQETVSYPTMQLDNLTEPPPPQSFPTHAQPPAPPESVPASVVASQPQLHPIAAAPIVAPPALSEAIVPPRPAVSLENRIGGQWLNRIGIIAVLVGLSYFLKLAFDNNWIGPPIRVAIGLGIGLGLLLWSERFRTRGFPGFSYSLKAIGFGAMYLSLWAAFQFYHLLAAAVAFGAMVAVTVTAAALSLRQNSELLAALALVGGFITPVLVSTNQNQEVPLLSYLALLDLGTIWLVAVKGWRRIILGSLVGTALLFAGWALDYYTAPQLAVTLGFVSFFFLLYALAPFVGSKQKGEQDLVTLTALVLLNAAGYFTACYAMLFENNRQELAWLMAGVAVLYFVLSRALHKQEPAFAAALYLGCGVFFLTAAIPLQLHGRWITLGWIVEAGVLFWASHRINRTLLRILGSLTLLLGVERLVTLESLGPEPLLINPRFALYLLAIAALALLAYFASHEGEGDRKWAGVAVVCLNVLALVALHFEVLGYFEPQLNASGLSPAETRSITTIFGFAYSAIWMIYGSVLMVIGFWKRSAFVRWQAIILLALTVAKVFAFDTSDLDRGYRIVAFIGLGVILLAVSYYYQRSRVRTAENL
jgi:uncharacterized membrane protein